MKVGSAEIYANHPMLVIGASATPPYDLVLDGTPAVASEAHAIVATRGQTGLTRVSVWNGAGPLNGAVVFDGDLLLETPHITIADVEGLSVFRVTVGVPGSHRIVITVDDPGSASRIDVICGSGPDSRTLTAAPDYELFAVLLPATGQLLASDELALILSGHDIPVSRLAAAVRLIGENAAERPAVRLFWIRMIAEWLRWLHPNRTLDQSRNLAQPIEDKLLGGSTQPVDPAGLAEEILRRAAK